jgi:carotenoid cleavage dioxygenase
VIDVMKFDVALFPLPDGSPSVRPQARLFRDLDLTGANTFKVQLDDRAGGSRASRTLLHERYRHGWIVSGNVVDTRTGEPRLDGITHYDLVSGKSATWTADPADRFGEPVFVPRRDDAAEGDGWVLSVVYRGAEARSDLAVFEATDIARGPVALAHLSSKVPAGFHGNWRPGPLGGGS